MLWPNRGEAERMTHCNRRWWTGRAIYLKFGRILWRLCDVTLRSFLATGRQNCHRTPVGLVI